MYVTSPFKILKLVQTDLFVLPQNNLGHSVQALNDQNIIGYVYLRISIIGKAKFLFLFHNVVQSVIVPTVKPKRRMK